MKKLIILLSFLVFSNIYATAEISIGYDNINPIMGADNGYYDYDIQGIKLEFIYKNKLSENSFLDIGNSTSIAWARYQYFDEKKSNFYPNLYLLIGFSGYIDNVKLMMPSISLLIGTGVGLQLNVSVKLYSTESLRIGLKVGGIIGLPTSSFFSSINFVY